MTWNHEDEFFIKSIPSFEEENAYFMCFLNHFLHLGTQTKKNCANGNPSIFEMCIKFFMHICNNVVFTEAFQ